MSFGAMYGAEEKICDRVRMDIMPYKGIGQMKGGMPIIWTVIRVRNIQSWCGIKVLA